MVIDDSKTIRHSAETFFDGCGVPRYEQFQATRKINRDPDIARIPVVILSVKNEASDRQWGLRQGAREYLTKPCLAQELIDAARRNVGPT